jgi:hypothetical protein
VSDRRRRNPRSRWNSLVAAAEVITATNKSVNSLVPSRSQTWQRDAWDFYDAVGELRFGCQWIANAMSRVNLVAAMPPLGPGDEPTSIDLDDDRTTAVQRRAVEIVSSVADGNTGQGQLLASFGIQLTVAGLAWLVVEPDPDTDAYTRWEVLSSEEVRADSAGRLEVRVSEREWRPVAADALVIKVWRRHPRKQWEPDAPTRGVMSVLREIDLLTKHIHASAQSRLAGAGILAIPSEAVFPPGQGPQTSRSVDPDDENVTAAEDTFVETLIEGMTVPLTDRGSAAAVVPLVIKVPGELVDKIKHLRFDTPFDERVLALMENAIKRLALGLDIPPEILTGTSGMNHWGAWQVAEEAITMHIEPLSETVVNALTVGYLRPALEAEGFAADDIAEVMVWYDTSDLRTRPDRSKGAIEAYDRYELSGTALLREIGLNVDDLPDDDERRQRLLTDIARSNAALAPLLLAELGLMAAPDVAAAQTPIVREALPEAPQTQGPPEQPTEPEAATAGLVAACDIVVRRALERAGARLRSAAGKRTPGGAAAIDCPDPTRLHLALDATEHADLTALLDGAWTWVPDLAGQFHLDVDALQSTLDAYTRALLAAGQEHTHDRLAAAFGVRAAG